MITSSFYYTKGQFIDFCQDVFGEGHLTNSGVNISVVCPICKKLKEKQSRRIYSKQKLSIHVETHMLHCWVCGYKAKNLIYLIEKYSPNHLDTYLKKYLNAKDLEKYISKEKKQKKISSKKVKLPRGFFLLATNTNMSDPSIHASRNYLKSRGADSKDMLWYWRIGITKDDRRASGRIIIPSFDSQGNLNYYSARLISNNKMFKKQKYLNPEVIRENIIFNELNINWKKELILVEGIFDLMKCPENATMLLGSELPSHFLLFQKIVENKTPITLALDPEAQNKSFEIAKKLKEFDIDVKIVDYKPNQEDVGSLTKNEFNEILYNASLFNTEYYLRSKINTII